MEQSIETGDAYDWKWVFYNRPNKHLQILIMDLEITASENCQIGYLKVILVRV